MKSFGELSVAFVKSLSLLCWHCAVQSASLGFGLATGAMGFVQLPCLLQLEGKAPQEFQIPDI